MSKCFPNNLQAIVSEERSAGQEEKAAQATQRSLAVFLCPLKYATNPKYVTQVWNTALRMQSGGVRGITQLLNLACRSALISFRISSAFSYQVQNEEAFPLEIACSRTLSIAYMFCQCCSLNSKSCTNQTSEHIEKKSHAGTSSE